MKNCAYPEMKFQPTGRIVTVELFTLDELSEEARERAYSNWLDEYRESYEFVCDVQYSDVIHYGEKALASVGINAEWDSWDNCFPGNYADPYNGRYLPYVNAADYLGTDWSANKTARQICHMEDYGYYSSMDMAEAFNAYETRLLQLVDAWENATNYEELMDTSEKFASLHREACEKACKVFQHCYEDEKEYQESFERFEDEYTQGSSCRMIDGAGRVFYSDNRKWYLATGALYDQSNVNHACVSIVKAR